MEKASERNNLIVPLVFFAMLVIVMFLSGMRDAHAAPSSIQVVTQATATSTLAYMTPGTATTTFQIDSGNVFSSGKPINMMQVDGQSMNIITYASTSVSKIDFQVQMSNNNIDWYPLNVASSTSIANTVGNIYSIASSTYEYNIGSLATTTMQFNLPLVPALHERLVFTDPIGASNLGFYTEYDLKLNPSTP